MKYRDLILSLLTTIGLVLLFNSRLGILPPLGKFLNPIDGVWQNAECADALKDGSYSLEGLQQEVKVYFDERLVPHVFAQSNEDMYFMQGYLTAKYRLWQMEIQTHSAAGRLTEIVGEKALENDRRMRRLGMNTAAEAAKEYIAKNPESKRMIDAYCKGVNSYIKNLKRKDYPIEYKLLDYQPEEWTPVKVALLLKNMANLLSVYEYDIENTNFQAKYGEDEFEKLYPDFIEAEDPIIPSGTPWGFGKPAASTSTASRTSGKQTYSSVLEKPDEINGSNNWAVNGTKTKSGKPILCNDPHLKLSLPSIWYEMHLVSPTMNVYGATLPGSPAVIIGFNDYISWGVTNGGRDVRDWYQIKFKDDSREEYEYKGEWVKAAKRPELFLVRGKGAFRDTIIYTKFGPVVFDDKFSKAESNKNMAMAWVAHLPSNEFETFYHLNRGKNYDDYMEALNHFNCPSQNFVFASRSGDIAIRHQGKFAVVDSMGNKGKMVHDGNSDKDEWKEYIPMEHNPAVLNPARGFVSSANQRPTDAAYPYYYSGVGVFENYRNRRINQLLSAGKDIDVDFMKKMQNDNYNLHASEALPVMMSLLDVTALNDDEKKIAKTLGQWNFYNNPEEVAPVYFEIWWNELRRLLWDEMSDPKVPMKQPGIYVTTKFLATDSTSAFYDITSTPQKETRAELVLRSFQHIRESLEKKEFTETTGPYAADKTYKKKTMDAKDWGTYKSTKIAHLAGIDAFSHLNVYNGGNLGIINATNATHGPSWRMIVDEATMNAYVVYPGGQSGNPGSPYYDNMIKAWAKGEYFPAAFVKTGEELGDRKLFISTFKPK